jgi:hypothetical protein
MISRNNPNTLERSDTGFIVLVIYCIAIGNNQKVVKKIS